MKNTVKKTAALALALLLTFGLTACGGGTTPSGAGTDTEEAIGITEFCQAYAGTWTSDNNEFISFNCDETDGYFLWGIWASELGRGYGRIVNIEDKGDGLYALSVYYEAVEETMEYGAFDEETVELYIDTSSADESDFLLCDIYSDDFIAYQYDESKQFGEMYGAGDIAADADLLYSVGTWYDNNGASRIEFYPNNTGYVSSGSSTGMASGDFTYTLDGSTLCITAHDGEKLYMSFCFGENCLVLSNYVYNYVFTPGDDTYRDRLKSDTYDFLIGKWYGEKEGVYYRYYADGNYSYGWSESADEFGGCWNACGNELFCQYADDPIWSSTYVSINMDNDTHYTEIEGYRVDFVRVN